MPKVEVYSSSGNLMTETELDLSGLNVMTDVNVADSVLVFDASAAANKRATVEEFMEGAISTATALTAVDVADKIPVYDTSASAYKYATAEETLKGLLATATTATIASGDYLLFRDISNSDVLRKDTIANVLALGGSISNYGYAVKSADQTGIGTSATKVTFPESIDVGSNYASDTFTARNTKNHLFWTSLCGSLSSTGQWAQIRIYVNGSEATNSRLFVRGSNATGEWHGSRIWLLSLTAGDTVEIYVIFQAGSTNSIYGATIPGGANFGWMEIP